MTRKILAILAGLTLAGAVAVPALADGPVVPTVTIDGVVLGVPPGYGGGVQEQVTLGVPPGFGGQVVPMSGCLVLAVPAGLGGGERVVC